MIFLKIQLKSSHYTAVVPFHEILPENSKFKLQKCGLNEPRGFLGHKQITFTNSKFSGTIFSKIDHCACVI